MRCQEKPTCGKWKYFIRIVKNMKINGTKEPGRAFHLPGRAGPGQYFRPVQGSSIGILRNAGFAIGFENRNDLQNSDIS